MKQRYAILAPCFNESLVIKKFLDDLESKLARTNKYFIVIIVDDASNDLTPDIIRGYRFQSPNFELKSIRLKFNMGHQEAIRQGLIYTKNSDLDIDGIIVMDSDGEDDPNAIAELVKIETFDVVFVERGKRKERLSFRLGYFFYRLLFRLVTGKSITFGNYSLISPMVLDAIALQYYFHYPGFLSKQRYNVQKLQYDRQNRLDGRSKMNFKNLVFHGLYSLIEYAEEILFSLLKLFIIILTALFVTGGFAIYSKYVSLKAVPGWASYIGINLVISGLIIISTVIIGLLLLSIKKTINQRSNSYDKVS